VSGAVMSACWKLLMLPGVPEIAGPPELVPDSPGLPQVVPASPSCTGELVAAAVPCSERWLEIADVIIFPDRPGDPGPDRVTGWLTGALARFPGAAIAATAQTAAECCIAARGGTLITVFVRGVRPAPLVAGCLAYAWLAAGLPLSALDGAGFGVESRLAPHGQARHGGMSLSWSLLCLGSGAGPRLSIRDLTWLD
jgi:hypothetical protein